MIEISNYKEHRKNTLRGFFDVRLTNMGLEIRGCCLHEKDGNQWIQLPSKPFEKDDDSMGWKYILDFYKSDKREAFQNMVLDALKQMI